METDAHPQPKEEKGSCIHFGYHPRNDLFLYDIGGDYVSYKRCNVVGQPRGRTTLTGLYHRGLQPIGGGGGEVVPLRTVTWGGATVVSVVAVQVFRATLATLSGGVWEWFALCRQVVRVKDDWNALVINIVH